MGSILILEIQYNEISLPLHLEEFNYSYLIDNKEGKVGLG